MRAVISIGGSLVASPPTNESFKKYAAAIRRINAKCEKLVVVVGGGQPAREAIAKAKALNLNENEQDLAGIKATHQNALRLSKELNANTEIPKSDEQVKEMSKKTALLVCGGTKPKQSTDNVAAHAASAIKADMLVNASNVQGVYDKDPKKNKDAKIYDKLDYDMLIGIVKNNAQKPGEYALFDLKAAELCKKEKRKIVFIDGKNPENIEKAVSGEEIGTVVS